DAVQRDVADQGRTDEKIVLVKMARRMIVVEMEAEQRGVTVPVRVLSEDVGDVDALIAEVRRVQLAVGIFFELMKGDGVELIAIVRIIAEQAHAEIDIAEDEAAKIRDERLNAAADGRGIEIGVLFIRR